VIRAQRDRGATVFLNSHLLSEIEVTCDRVAFIRDGEIVDSRDLHQHQSTTGRRVRITAQQLMPSVVNQLTQWSRATELSESGLLVDVVTDEAISAIVRHLVGAGAEVTQVVTESTSLEDVFVRLVGEDRGL
jgi:ABC-2 type transport system ATP-binding protein